ncbi:xanthine dehydrogenase family protein molybdopterin-binding subunit [uncultured Spirosoma sp.]|uniref:xanthine dehydrogenase family protein molybdopterin-binding subunit n=1 Tax=uncultured Spirosoma sp. TaxID=278208 RepID=UPI00258F893C|nr:xanthine dehydrogenase family protein molybdopterin-binding subunit [uncultured Spirosoma sp.]
METDHTAGKEQIGRSMSRVDGRLKVTGGAKYAAEYELPELVYGVLVTSTIARGRIRSFDTRAAEKLPGVLAIMTYKNAPAVPGYKDTDPAEKRVAGQELRVFFDDQIQFSNQPVALAIADTLEKATYAASLVNVVYDVQKPTTDLSANLTKAYTPERPDDYSRGVADAYKQAAVRIEQEYHTPVHVHNPMEPHAATAVWEGDNAVTVYNKTQGVSLAKKDIQKLFGLSPDKVRVHSPFVGGAFGSSSRIWPPEMAALLGAKLVKRPVKVVAKREQVFNLVGYRPESIQRVALGATAAGKLTGITHHAVGLTSQYEQFTERILHPTKSMYQSPNLNATYRLVGLDLSTPCWARGPGETTGSFALESAMDELAYALNMDPLALRRANFAETDPESKKPWSSNYLRDCYEQGARAFGWEKRDPTPRSMHDGEWLVGMGMSAGIYKSDRAAASARARLGADGSLLIQTAAADVGPGTYTILTQIAAETMGIDASRVRVELGDSAFPLAPPQYGSHTAVSVGSAVHDACQELRRKLAALTDNGKRDATAGQVEQSHETILRQHNLPELVVVTESKGGAELETVARRSFAAHFVAVQVHPTLGTVRVTKIVSAIDAGKVLNPKTARSQVLGAATWSIGMALMEEGVIDDRSGRYVNNNLADYHVPVVADMPAIEVIFIDKNDSVIDPMGAKGLGEISMTGMAAAITNAIYHATGKRIRHLPATPDKLMA